MKLSRLLSLSLSAVGSVAAARVLQRRHQWEQTHNRVAICVDFDDAYSAAVRAGMSFDDLLHKLPDHGATHLALPELTLNRLLNIGQLTPKFPVTPKGTPPRVGHWNYLGGDSHLVSALASELSARLPHTEAHVLEGNGLAFAGELQTIGQIGLGFDAFMAERIKAKGLALVPRPVSYAWPEDDLITLTLAQAAVFGKLIAFDGDMILGHEMHLNTTLDAMEREGLSLVYFAESRHQKGDWFVAKRRAPNVVIGHRFTPAEMIPFDFHAAAHHWAYLARERGVRFCYVNFFKVLHATEPLEGLHYIEHIKEALEHGGFVVTSDVGLPTPVPQPSKADLALTGLASAGAVSAAVASTFNLSESASIPLTLAAAGGVAALPYLERARSRLEDQYAPSYAPKLIALTASLAPAIRSDDPLEWGSEVLLNAAAGAAMAASLSGQDYHLRIEEYRGFNLDWALPLASAAMAIPDAVLRVGSLGALAVTWLLFNQRQIDPLARFDPAHAEGHTHHLSTAARLIGDAKIALGPQPARKWAGLGAAGTALSVVLASRGKKYWAVLAAMIGAMGYVFGMIGWRRPERALKVTTREALPNLGMGAVIGMLALLLYREE
ncbi:MAG TPA: DUF5693 family protein [Anaerolineales bacterium]|nr:DUF5693 family protein [Anaerolineales bacterium]